MLFHQRSVLPGDRGALMGGAYTAIADDISSAVYNPAGLTNLEYPAVSMSATAYSYQHFKRTNTITPDPIDNELRSVSQMPTAFGLNFKMGDSWAGALSLFQIAHLDFNSLGFNGDKTNSIALSINEDGWLGGPSLAYKQSDKFSVGFSLLLHYEQISSSAVFESPALNDLRENSFYSIGLLPVLGVQWKPADAWRFGATMGAETIPLSGKNDVVYRPIDPIPPFIGPTTRKSVKGDARIPNRISLGMAHVFDKGSIASVDVIYYGKLDYAAPNEPLRTSEDDNRHKEKEHLDFSVGMEVPLTGHLAMQGGVFSNTSGATQQYQSEKVDMYGASWGIYYMSERIQTGGGIVAQHGQSGNQVSSYSPGIGFADSAKWQASTIGFVFGGAMYF